jgi:hypothetical protein
MVKNTKGGSSHKKLARKKEDAAKTIKVDLNVDFKNYMLAIIDKNLGNCFTAKMIHYEGISKEYHEKELKVLHQRGRNAKYLFNKTQSKLALVSLVTDFKLTNNCIGYVEEFLLIDHLDAYYKNKLINMETYDKLSQYMTSTADEITERNEGFEFERSGNIKETVDEKEESSDKSEDELDIDTI